MPYLDDTLTLIKFSRTVKNSPVVIEMLQEHLGAEIVFIQDKETSTECIVAAVEGFGIVLAFRGSKEFQDWVFTNPNMKFSASPLGDMHTGYRLAYKSVQSEIVSAVSTLMKQNPELDRFYITGHSLGGALAVTAAAYAEFSRDFPKIHAVHTYGQPRVFCRPAAKQYDELLKTRTFRFMTAGDGVTTLPPSIFRYRHVGQIQYFQPNGELNLNPSKARMNTDRLLDYLTEFLNWEWFMFEDHSLELIEHCVKKHIKKRGYL